MKSKSDRWIYTDDKFLGKIYCPEHGLQPMVGIFSEKGKVGSGCVEHYGTLKTIPQNKIKEYFHEKEK